MEGFLVKKVVVSGGSAGGIQALCSILKEIPADFPAPLLAVIHIAEKSTVLSTVLQRCSARRHEKASERKCVGCGARYSIVGRSPPKIMKSIMKSATDGVSTPGKLLSIPLDLKCLEN